MSGDTCGAQNAPPVGAGSSHNASGPATLASATPPAGAVAQWGQVPYGPPPPHQYMPPPGWGPHYWGYQAPYAGPPHSIAPPPPPPPPPHVPPVLTPSAAGGRVVYDLTGDGPTTRGSHRGRGDQNRSSDQEDRREPRDRGRPPSPRYRRQSPPHYRRRGDERSRSPPPRRTSQNRPASPPRLRGRFNDFLDRVDELEMRNHCLERRNEELTEQNHDLRRQLREAQNNRAPARQPSTTSRAPPASLPARQTTGHPTTAGAPPIAAPPVNTPAPPVATVSSNERPLEDRMESLPLLQRMEQDSAHSSTPMTIPGDLVPSNVDLAAIHGEWHNYVVNTVEDYSTIRDAANRGSDSALLYIGFLNAMQQRVPITRRSLGVKELLKDWSHFSKPHEARRVRLHEKHGIKLRTKPRKASDTGDETSSVTVPDPLPDNSIAMDMDPVPAPGQRAVSEPTRTSAPRDAVTVAPTEDTQMGQAGDHRLSANGLHFATIDPADWPSGIRADIAGQPVPVNAQMLRTPHSPWADDVHAWEVMHSLAPAIDENDPTSSSRRDAFLQLAVRLFAVKDYLMVLYGRMSAPMGDRPVEPYPFELDPYNMVHVAAWFHDHGIELESETAENLHQYSIFAYPFLPGALPDGPPTLGQMLAGSAGQRTLISAAHFQYPALHFSQPGRNWTTATEDYFIAGRAGQGSRPITSFPPVPPALPTAVRPTTGPYSIAAMSPTEAPRSAPTPEPGPSMADLARRSPSEVVDYEGSDYDGPTKAEGPAASIQPNILGFWTEDRTQAIFETITMPSWDAQMPRLVRAYLAWKHGASQTNTVPEDMDTEAEGGSVFHVTAIGITSRQRMRAIHQKENEPANLSLLRQGLLGCSPETPSVAFSLETLELYHRLRRRHGRLSVQTMARVLCDMHDYTYHKCHREQLDIAFDAYLDILRRVEKLVNAELGRDGPHWRARNSCPPCHYELEDETPLVPRAWYAQDGNYSLKRAASAGLVDQRQFSSTYNLSRTEVDVFKDEVKRKAPVDGDFEEAALGGSDEHGGDVTDAQELKTTCTKNWKAANSANKKSAFEIYETNGIFPVACRHGLIITFAEMVRSNELAKYPLATTNFLLEVFGYDVGLGADIGCSFAETIRHSNLLKDKAARLRLQVVVNAFHGWAHNHLCQLQHHPLYRKGAGLEDLETLERIFSASNNIARTIRHATRFHWLQAVDLHFRQWDEEKYQELSSFMYNNYKQALVIIKDYTTQLNAFKAQFLVTDAVIESWIDQELKFLEDLKEEPEDRILAVSYVEALMLLQSADEKWNRTSNAFSNTTFDVSNYGANSRVTARLEADRRAAMDQQLVAIRAVTDLEAKLGLIGARWTHDHPDFVATLEYMRQREYHRALDRIQQLVVQRLFELSKANLSEMGYKLRDSIWKALKVRSKAVQSALDRYNAVAPLMKPPAPKLEWKQIMDYVFISEFELLKYLRSHRDITNEPWSRPVYREATTKFFKLRGAHEELVRVNVEARRLRTSIRDEHLLYESHIARLEPSDALLAAELRARYATRRRVNALHNRKLDKLEALPGFTGICGPGTRLGAQTPTGDEGTADSEDDMRAFMTAADRQQRVVINGDEEDIAEDEEHVHEQDSDDDVGDLAVKMSEVIVDEPVEHPLVNGVPTHMLYSWSL
ncbi:hypothetical protein HWV62_4742 [Athelia sp. TMB]|nr:hypothetical protein HWV62_4742 [Athelia sp. TMB]